MKKTLIATAVSAALMAPVAAQADVTVYGRIHQGIQLVNPEVGESTTDFINVGSRFGIKASSDLGNGMTASAHYEFTTDSDVKGSGVANTRIATVGVSGGFGSVDLGQQWGAYYNKVGVHVDPTFNVGGLTYGLFGFYADELEEFGFSEEEAKALKNGGGPFRTPNTIKYSNSFGPVSLELDARLDGSEKEGGDGLAAAVSVAVNDNITLAAAIDDTEDSHSLMGGAIKVSIGNYWASVAQHSVDIDGVEDTLDASTTQFWVGGNFGNTSAMLGTGRADLDIDDNAAGNDPSDVTLGIYHDLGGGLKLLYEGNKKDTDGFKVDDKGKDKTVHLFGISLDF